MKIFTGNAVFIQKNDMAYLNRSDLPIPASIFMKFFGSGVTIIDDSNRYEFVKFEEDDEIEFFRGVDWILDYDDVKDLTRQQIIEFGQCISEEKNKIASQYNAMSNEDKIINMYMVEECELLDYKMLSLRDYLWCKEGKLQFAWPKELKSIPVVQERGLRRILRNLINPNNR